MRRSSYRWRCPYCHCFYRRRRRRRRRRFRFARAGARAAVNNGATVDGPVSGLINIIIQVPVNTGDATSFDKSHENSLSNVL